MKTNLKTPRKHSLVTHDWLLCIVTSIVLLTDIFTLAAVAYDGQVVANLKRSRDALLTQKTELESATHRIDEQVAELHRQHEQLDAYLRDTDRALRDVETALKVSSQ